MSVCLRLVLPLAVDVLFAHFYGYPTSTPHRLTLTLDHYDVYIYNQY